MFVTPLLMVTVSAQPNNVSTATMTARIIRSVAASSADWEKHPPKARREIVEQSPTGQIYLVRIRDFE